MPHIEIISSSVRDQRNSHRVALYLQQYIKDHKIGTVGLLDLKELNFPLFDERLSHLAEPSEVLLQFSKRIKEASAVIIVTPEYNGGYPASLKNAIDVLYEEWYHKPIALAPVSDGNFGGTQVVTSLTFTLWKIKAKIAAPAFHTANVTTSFDDNGNAADTEATNRRAATFFRELLSAV